MKIVRLHKSNTLSVSCPWNERHFVSAIPIKYWDKGFKVWLIPLFSKANLKAINTIIESGEFEVTRDANREVAVAIKTYKRNKEKYKIIEGDISKYPTLPVLLNDVTLDPEQEIIYNKACRVPSYPLFMDAGTGKTMVALAIIAYKNKFRSVKKVYIVYFNPNIGEWLDHIEKYYPQEGLKLVHKGVILKNNKKPTLTIELMNYDIVSANKQRLLEWRPDMIVADESQNIKNKASHRTRDLTHIGDFVKHKNILTGTEIDGKYHDYYSQFRFMSPDMLASTWDIFTERYCIMGRHHNIEGYRNVKQLKKTINKYSYYVLSDTLNIPISKHKLIEMDNINKKYYNELKVSRVLKAQGKRIMTSYTISKRRKLLEITSGFLLTDYDWEKDYQPILYFKRNPKLEWTMKFLTSHKQKIIVFCNRIPEVKMLSKACKQHGVDYIILDGSVKDTDKTKKLFRDKHQVLIQTINKGGIGLNLQFCSTTIFYSLPESWIAYTQAIKRTYRRDQLKHAKFYTLMIKGSEDYVVKDALDNKQDYVTYIKGGK